MAEEIHSPAPRVQVSAELTEIATWLSNIRAPGVFDTRMPFLISPESLKVINLEEHMPVPSRIRKNLRFTDTTSFVDYFNLFKNGYKPRLFTKKEATGLSILCVFDYDGPSTEVKKEDGTSFFPAPQPQWGDHIANLNLQYAPDYQELLNGNNKWMSQQEFALFVEENTHLFTQPDGATMLELAQELKGNRNASWKSGKRLSNGQTSLEYIETIDARSRRGNVDVPEYILVTTPIFDGYEAKECKLAFRWRMTDEGRVEFGYRLLTKLVERDSVEQVKKGLADLCGMPIYSVSMYTGIGGR